MERHLTEKQKVLLRILGMTILIYVVFKYMIPLLIPFLIAALLSIPMRPAARFLYKRFHIPMGMAAGIVLAAIGAGLGGVLFWLGKIIAEQLAQLAGQLPLLWQDCCDWLFGCCSRIEEGLQLNQGAITEQVTRFTDMDGDGLGSKALAGMLDGAMTGSFQGIKVLFQIIVTVFITIGATLITTTQLEEIKRAIDRSLFREEIHRVTGILGNVGRAYGKTQLLIMILTMLVSGIGLTLLGNSYAVLVGILIGLLDALPLFGTGTILFPWIALSLFAGNWTQAIVLAGIYGICNLMRQMLEARYMGDQIGLSALENLAAMYVGMKLFGLLGLFWGPIGYLLIKDNLFTEGSPSGR